MKPITKIIVGLLLCLALATSASAKVFTAKVTGVVTRVSDRGSALDGSISVGSAMTGFYIYDTNTPDKFSSNPSFGSYPIMSLSMTIGHYTFTHDPAIALIIKDLPTLPYVPLEGVSWDIWTDGYSYSVASCAPRFDGIVYINGSPKTFDDISWDYRNNYMQPVDVRSSWNEFNLPDTLPETIPFSTFDLEKSFETHFYGSGCYFSINGQITSLVAVPWPFQFTPNKIVFQSYPGDPNPPPQVLSIWAEEGNTVNWQITKDCNWLDVSPASGQSSGEIDQVTLSVNTAGLDIGYYSCSLAISDPNIPDSTRFLPVNLLIGQGMFVPGQYPTIQAAIDDANDGNTVYVAPGTYTGPGNYSIDFEGKAITVRSQSDSNKCIVDCQGHSGFNFHGGEDVNSILKGFIITDSYGRAGGAIRCDNGSPKITDCIITGNSYSNGAIYCQNSHPEIIDCNITGNSGSGIACWNSNPVITGCEISDNSTPYDGGGIRCDGGSSLTITNCTITGNSAGSDGGGIYGTGDVSIANCVIVGNSASGDTGGIYSLGRTNITNCTICSNSAGDYGGGLCASLGLVNLTNCIFWANNDDFHGQSASAQVSRYPFPYGGRDPTKFVINYCCIQGWAGTLPNIPTIITDAVINADPFFVKPGHWVNANDPNIIVEPNDPNAVWLDGDYHLLPTSPCINTGDPNFIPEPNETDLDGLPRVIGGRIDMGAYEFNAVRGKLTLSPSVIETKSNGKWLIATLVIPPVPGEQVNTDEPLRLYPGGIEADHQHFSRGTSTVVIAFFDRQQVTDDLGPGQVEVNVVGKFLSGRFFFGSDTIKIVTPKPPPNRWHW